MVPTVPSLVQGTANTVTSIQGCVKGDVTLDTKGTNVNITHDVSYSVCVIGFVILLPCKVWNNSKHTMNNSYYIRIAHLVKVNEDGG